MPNSNWMNNDMPNLDSSVEQHTFQQQVIQKLATMDVSMREGFRRLDEKFASHRDDLHKVEVKHIEDNVELDKRVTANAAAISELNTWTKVVQARIAGYTGFAFVLWAVFGNNIQKVLGLN